MVERERAEEALSSTARPRTKRKSGNPVQMFREAVEARLFKDIQFSSQFVGFGLFVLRQLSTGNPGCPGT